MEAACKAKLIPLNGINLKKLFNEDTNSSSEKPTIIPTSPIMTIDQMKSPDSSDTVCDKNDADFVKIYHSYALKTAPTSDSNSSDAILKSKQISELEIEESSNSNTIVDTINTTVDTINTTNDELKHSELSHDIISETIKDKIQIGPKTALPVEDDEEIDDNEDDYFNDDDDDELSRIKQKYSLHGDDYEDIEDCGF